MVILKRFFILSAVMFIVIGLAGNGICAKESGKININKAPVEQLVQLDRIGAKYAQRIVEYREKNGPFKQPEDIMKVKGIGTKVWEANKDMISVK
ncbi:MAG: ComEA family DNA-binding protein [Deltaproteobacteria bacterium]|nr:ComEA family DNA-binding protein [Deltaproteobacteria bacterium]